MTSPIISARRSDRADGDGLLDLQVAVLDGLSRRRKALPCRFLYDERGSELFELITELPEYYPTRTEAQILHSFAVEIAASIPSNAVLIEFGSGSSTKTELLLQHLPPTVPYVPVDVSPSALAGAQQRLMRRFPALFVYPIVGSFTDDIDLPVSMIHRPRVGFFPGSTIGNWTPAEAGNLLKAFRGILHESGRLIVGVDLKKDPRTLVQAYNDKIGITAAFNRNILARINRELGSAIDLDTFRHEAIYDPLKGRIEMHLVSTIEQSISVCGRRFHFHAGETIHTENSYKYTVAEFQDLARSAGWSAAREWTDPAGHFSIHELTASPRVEVRGWRPL